MVGSVAVEKREARFVMCSCGDGWPLRAALGTRTVSGWRASWSSRRMAARGRRLCTAGDDGDAVVTVVLLLESSEEGPPRLTRRELECLRWTLLGKTAWEVGTILGIAEQTAARHLHHASRKLGCVSKHQAALRAVHLQLIAPRGPSWPAPARRK